MKCTKHNYKKGEELIVLVDEQGGIVDKLTPDEFAQANINLKYENVGEIM
jgi:hypothetical protein